MIGGMVLFADSALQFRVDRGELSIGWNSLLPRRSVKRLVKHPAASFRVTLGLIAGLISVCTRPSPLRAEIDLPPVANGQTTGADGTGVYLDDSLEGADVLIRADALIRTERWREAAELLQSTSDRFGDKLYRISAGYYVGLRDHINSLIAAWPTAGLEAYRSLYEHEIERALSQLEQVGKSGKTARTDPHFAKRLDLFYRYFCTQAALPLANAIGQAAIESGDLALAESVWTTTLEKHPDAVEQADYLRAMLAIVRALQSATTGDHRQQADAANPFGADQQGVQLESRGTRETEQLNTRIRWKGQDRLLRDILTDISDQFRPPSRSTQADEWPTFGGSYSRDRITHCSVDDLGVQWRFSFRADRRNEDPDDDSILTESVRDRARDFAIHPVVAGGLVFVQRYREIIALRQNTGEIVWQFRADSVERDPPSFIQEQPPRWDAPTVAGGRVYASIPGPASSFHSYGTGDTPHELVCLDAASGAVMWRVSERALAARFAEVRFDPSPIIEHDQLYVVGRRRRSFGFEDAYLFRFDASTGLLLGRTHIGSASTGTYGSQTATRSVAALYGDTVYVASNLGSVAAVAAFTGAIRWLRLYDRSAGGSGGAAARSSDVAPWHFNAVVVSAEGLVVQPMDAPHILVLARSDGRQLQSLPIQAVIPPESGEDRPPADSSANSWSIPLTLLGIRGKYVCIVSEQVRCIDLDTRQTRWSNGLPDSADLVGRARWAGDRILVSTTKGISMFAIENGERTDLSWPPAGEPGNLLALSDQLIVAGPETITSYVRKSEMWNRLRERLEAAPDDPVPALELAEVAMRSGETIEAVDALEVAVSRLIKSDASTNDDEIRSRLFRNAVSFAEGLTQLSTDDDAAILGRLFEVAARFPTDRADHLSYRLKFALLFERVAEPNRALTLYQQVLQDRSLRELPVPGHGSVSKAAPYCRDRISELIADHGPELYEPFEKEAERLLQAGRAAGDEATISRVVHAFPNSRVVPQATITLGEMLGRTGRTKEAAQLLIHAYHRYPAMAASNRWTTVTRAELIKRIADTFEWGGRREDAYRWLTKGALEYPGIYINDGDKQVTFHQYRERLSDVRDQVEPTRPAMTLPLGMRFTREFSGPTALLIPRFATDPLTRWTRAYVYDDRQIHAIQPTTGTDIWRQPAPTRESVDLLLARDDVAVFATTYQLFGIDPATGERRWSHGEYPSALKNPLVDWEQGETIRTITFHGHVVVLARDGGTITAVDVRSGKLLWSTAQQLAPAGPIALNDEWIVYHVMQDGHALLCLIHPATGEWIDSIITGEPRPVEELLLTLDGQILMVTSQSMTAIDPVTGTVRWRVSTLGHFRRVSILLDVDAVYCSPDGRDLRKVSLDDGHIIWQIAGLMGRGEDDFTIDRHDAQLIVSSTRSVVAVDAVTGMNLWRGTTPPDPRFHSRALTRNYAVAIHLPDDQEEREGQAFFYDLRNASGLIPENGAPQLGNIEDVRRILLANEAILLQSGPTTILGVSHKPNN
jgi:outer membrane protein assembly factor BamB/tetratricopeptide (TPR) repeat protein